MKQSGIWSPAEGQVGTSAAYLEEASPEFGSRFGPGNCIDPLCNLDQFILQLGVSQFIASPSQPGALKHSWQYGGRVDRVVGKHSLKAISIPYGIKPLAPSTCCLRGSVTNHHRSP